MGYVHSGLTAFDDRLKHTLDSLNLTQLIDEPTRLSNGAANLRDLIITNNSSLVVESGILPSFSKIDHFPIYVSFAVRRPSQKIITKSIWDYENTG